MLVGGGLGRTPFIAKTIKPFVSRRDILSYVEAILRVYNQYGRRDNIYKARIKILVHELGIETSPQAIADHYGDLLDGLVIDEADRSGELPATLPTRATRTLMQSLGDRDTLARITLEFADSLR